MDKSLGNIICIDWGFTHLKLIALDRNKIYIENKVISTNSITKNNKFYIDKDLKKVKNIIFKFLLKHTSFEGTRIYTCSQMHGIAGYFKSGECFFSTWNDVPRINNNFEKVYIDNGLPLLISMPINKLLIKNEKVFLNTDNTFMLFEQESIEIKTLSSPLCLILSEIFKQDMPCSNSWWHSSTIENNKIINSKKNIKVSEFPVTIEDKFIDRKFLKKITIFPEQGDLQASVYKSINEADIIINLGTGSQIIFCKQSEFTNLPYFRIFPKKGRIPVISHIPCGKLFNSFFKENNININKLNHTDWTSKESFKKPDNKNIKSLLFFPGYCSKENIYKNNNFKFKSWSKDIKLEEIFDLWLNQYSEIINFYINRKDSNKLKLHIVGNLSGFIKKNFSKFEAKFSNKYILKFEEISLIDSFEKMF